MGRAIFFGLLLLGSNLWASGEFPMGPDPVLTPGSLCTTPDAVRYPEKIPYCNRSVGRAEKWQIIKTYNKKFGYDINESNRGEFKIDHLIPLCAGGSNEATNLWPQHKSLYVQTDPLEPLACDKMKAGRLKQARAMELLIRAKLDLSQVPVVMTELEAL